jgi:hypothetical protein
MKIRADGSSLKAVYDALRVKITALNVHKHSSEQTPWRDEQELG